MSNMTTESIVQRNEKSVITTELGDELLMMDIENGKYISLNRTATVIWQNIDKPIKVQDLIEILINRYKMEKSQCTIDTIQYLETLIAQKIINIMDLYNKD
jgi:hypothetical protein